MADKPKDDASVPVKEDKTRFVAKPEDVVFVPPKPVPGAK